jgi:3-oxoacyl-[acyl-carrier protein] reductase
MPSGEVTMLHPQKDTRYVGLSGKVAVVSGGTKGIGLATARLLAVNGVRVVVNGRDRRGTEEAVSALRDDTAGEVIGIAEDVSAIGGCERLREQALEAYGAVNFVVAFAGGFSARTPFSEISLEEWSDVIHQNLTTTFYVLRTFLPELERSGGGAAVTMASNAGRLLDIPLTASYAAAKAGVVMLTRHVAREYGPAGIRVNCVAPATTLSPRVERLMSDDVRTQIAALSPLGRLGTPEDVAEATVFLVSDAASWLTGVTLDLSGGRVML